MSCPVVTLQLIVYGHPPPPPPPYVFRKHAQCPTYMYTATIIIILMLAIYLNSWLVGINIGVGGRGILITELSSFVYRLQWILCWSNRCSCLIGGHYSSCSGPGSGCHYTSLDWATCPPSCIVNSSNNTNW